jgi:hypothetical protein
MQLSQNQKQEKLKCKKWMLKEHKKYSLLSIKKSKIPKIKLFFQKHKKNLMKKWMMLSK